MYKTKIFIFSIIYFSSFYYSFAEEKYTLLNPEDITKDTTILSIESYKQKYNLSCEFASLKSALQFKNILVSEEELIRQINFDDMLYPIIDPITKDIVLWGDPEESFVGLITGKMPETGYGVYDKPIQKIASRYTNSKIIKNAKTKDLTKEIKKGNPIIVWGSLKEGKDISWKTRDGKTIKAIEGEHARVVVGFEGRQENPKYIFLMDPIKGNIKMTLESFEKDWGYLNNKAIVIK